MRPITLLRLAFSGSGSDRVRAALTVIAAFLAALGILATATVLNMAPTETAGWRYTTLLLNSTQMRPALIVMVTASVIPALILIAQGARIGGPARDRRLAAMRLAGASPRQCRAIAAVEQGFAVGLGAVLAVAAYPLAHKVLHRPTMEGARQSASSGEVPYTGPLLPLPTDTWPAWWGWIVAVIGLPVIAALLSALALRRVISPASSPRRRARPSPWPVLLLIGGLFGMAACRAWIDRLQAREQPVTTEYLLMVGALLAVCVAVPLCAAGVGYLAARLALRCGRRPATLVAARRVLADPYSGSRAVAVLLVCTVLIVSLVGLRTNFDFTNEVNRSYGVHFSDEEFDSLVMGMLTGLAVFFVGSAMVGLLISLVDNALTRRRTDAALLATGTPNATLIRARVMIVLLTAVPGVLLAVVTGFAAPTLALPPAQRPASVTMICHGFEETYALVPCTAEGVAQQRLADRTNGKPAYSHIEYTTAGPWRSVYPPIPWPSLAVYGGLALAATALATLLSLLVGRRSGAVAALRTI